MSEQARYSFLPYVRLGLGNQITETDQLGEAGSGGIIERPEVTVSFEVTGYKTGSQETRDENITQPVKVISPGDILGINPRQVLRAHPAPGVDNFETNNLAYIEFYEEDFPWRYTPAAPDNGRLRPWMALLLLKEEEFVRNTDGGTPTPFIRIVAGALPNVLYPEQELHHFAHVQVLDAMDNTIISNPGMAANELYEILKKNPDLALSRILCPKKPESNTEYHAFLVPAYETGRLAGMGLDTSTVPAQQPSWIVQDQYPEDLDMPFYYQWEFATGSEGDFSSLVSKLTPVTSSGNTGREMDLSDPGLGLHPTDGDDVALIEGALASKSHTTPAWPVADPQLKAKLLQILNLNEDLRGESPPPTVNQHTFYSPKPVEDPIVTPPIYGQWHAAIRQLTNNGNNWVHQLNLHPSHRAAAGLGTRVVQEHQEEFMEMAWNQIGPINEANQKIIENEAVKRASNSLYKKRLGKMNRFTLMNTLGKAMEVIKPDQNKPITARKALEDSRVPTALRTGTFTRIANNFSRTALMDQNEEDGAPKILNESLLVRADLDQKVTSQPNQQQPGDTPISPAPPRKPWSTQVSPFSILRAMKTIIDNPPPSFLSTLCEKIAKSGPSVRPTEVMDRLRNLFDEEQKKRARDILENVISYTPDGDTMVVKIKNQTFTERINQNYNEGIFPFPNKINGFQRVILEKSSHSATLPAFDQSLILEGRKEFRNKYTDVFLTENETRLRSFRRRQKNALQQEGFNDSLLEKFRPGLNLQRRLRQLVDIPDPEASKPLMAYPRFPFPVYYYLKELSPDYIIPNISSIPENSIAAMKPNTPFIEAFLTGMNQEFSRELLWREFPTDMRGSYFRHFWEFDNDPANEMLPMPHESESAFHQRIIDFQDSAADVHQLHEWKNKPLGDNHMRNFGLMLLVKGDLFRKYPDTMVYMRRGAFTNGSMPRQLDHETPDNILWPAITGMIEPDIHFFGFDLDPAAARGNTTNQPGWFFVLQERPGQISFGLAEHHESSSPARPQNWDDLTWSHLTPGPSAPNYLKVHDTPGNLIPHNSEEMEWGTSSANMACILYQSPVFFAKHASLLLKNS